MPKKITTVQSLLAKERWQRERRALRQIALDAGLEETVKWHALCYCLNAKNVAIFHGFADYCGFGFFKGTLFDDPDGRLHQHGENSQASRTLQVSSLEQIKEEDSAIRAFLDQAVAIEESGKRVDFKAKNELTYPDELIAAMDNDPELAAAFHALTPGRQRGHVLNIEGAKQSETRARRILKARNRIIAGKGFNERL